MVYEGIKYALVNKKPVRLELALLELLLLILLVILRLIVS